ncbi:MAG: hypothetical protein OXJ52_06060, partial [Oligoflexia bacterium]|nr:hypothetical protein [Oligoflexia bacterium]
MLKLRLFLVFAFLPSVSFAWNSSCYSPVQLSAFMSKPKKKSAGGVSRSSLRKISASISKLEEALDEAEGDLQDSLDKDKLKDKPSTVAGKIRDYIEDGQDGWDCAKGEQSSLFFFPSLIPQAYAHTDLSIHGHPHSEDNSTEAKVIDSVLDLGVKDVGSEPATSDNGSGDDDSHIKNLSQISVGADTSSSGKTRGALIEPEGGGSNVPTPRQSTAELTEQQCKEKQGYEWENSECVNTAEQQCKEKQGYEWENSECV